MKNQYFGDINDYKKYGLLRILTDPQVMKLAVCWMLTDADHRTDGQFIGYLQEPSRWRHIDPPLFDSLAEAVQTPETRDVRWMEEAGLLPTARFYRKILGDSATARRDYFAQFASVAAGSDLVFFDPDNGLEVKSKPYGRKDSGKFLYWDELVQTYRDGHSILIYQHFQRVERGAFLRSISNQVGQRLGVPDVIIFRTSNVAFLLIAQPRHREYLRAKCAEVARAWRGHIEVVDSVVENPAQQDA